LREQQIKQQQTLHQEPTTFFIHYKQTHLETGNYQSNGTETILINFEEKTSSFKVIVFVIHYI